MELLKLDKKLLSKYDIESYLKHYPFGKYYFKKLGIDCIERIKFLKSSIVNRVLKPKGNHNKMFIVVNNDGIQGIFGLDRNDLHSKVFGIDLFEIGPIYNFGKNAEDVFSIFFDYLKEISLEYEKVYFKTKIDSSDHINISLLNKFDFDYYASSQKVLYNHELNFEGFRDFFKKEFQKHKAKYEVKKMSKEKEQLTNVFKLIEQHSLSEHYFNYNEHFGSRKTKELFKEWFALYSKHPKTKLYSLTKVDTQEFIGFTSVNGPIEILGNSVYTRDLTIIDDAYRGQGLAVLLYKAIAEDVQSFIEGSPMVNNFENLRLNIKCGFDIVHSRSFFKWQGLNN